MTQPSYCEPQICIVCSKPLEKMKIKPSRFGIRCQNCIREAIYARERVKKVAKLSISSII